MKKTVALSIFLFWGFITILFAFGTIKGSGDSNAVTGIGLSSQNTQIPSEQGTVNSIAGDVPGAFLDKKIIALHAREDDCWVIIGGKVYNVTSYLPLHPGGVATILEACGGDATNGFNTKGYETKPQEHSKFAHTLLSSFYVGDIGVALPPSQAQGGGNTSTKPLSVSNPTAQETPTNNNNQAYPQTFNGVASGDTVKSSASLRVRATPSTSGNQVGTVSSGTTGTVTGAPVYADGYWWVSVDFGGGMKGWSVQDYITSASANISTNTTITTTTTSTPPPTGGYTAATVAQHSTASDCWLIISGNVYDLTQYIPFHPGGQSQITQYCGADGTAGFNNRGGTGSHSTSAQNQLANYLLGAFSTTTPPPSSDTTPPTVSITSPSDGSTISGTVTVSATASDASGILNVVFKVDGMSVKTDTSVPYNTSIDTATYSNASHTITATASDIAGNTQTATITVTVNNQSTPPPTGGYTAATVAQHSTASDCWLIISGNVYDLTQYIPFHPGGQNPITSRCGTDGTTFFNTNGGGGHNHSTSARSQLAGYLLGPLSTDGGGATQCTAFTYSSWGTCQPDGTQTRTVLTSSPSGCTGGSPITTQSCTYTPPPETPQTYTVDVNSSGDFSQTSLTLNVGDSIKFVYTNPGDEVDIRFTPTTISSLKLDGEYTQGTRTFSTAGTWTFKVKDKNGNTGTVAVQ